MANVEDAEVAQSEGFVERCEKQWERAVEHAKTYPYVWASYVVTFGGLGIYGAWRFRELRRMENQVMQYQRELLKRMKQEESAASQAFPAERVAAVPAVDNSTHGKAPLEV